MSAPALRVVHSTPDTIDARIDDAEWARLDNEVRQIIADGQAATQQQDRRGMLLAADLTALYQDGRWLDDHVTVGTGPATKADSADQFARWAVERYSIGRGYVSKLIRYNRRSEQFSTSTNLPLTVSAWNRIEAATGKSTYLSNRDKYIPQIVAKASELARDEGRSDVGAEQITLAAKAIQSELLNNPGIKLRKRTRADSLHDRIIGDTKQLIAMGQLRTLAEALRDAVELLNNAKADR